MLCQRIKSLANSLSNPQTLPNFEQTIAFIKRYAYTCLKIPGLGWALKTAEEMQEDYEWSEQDLIAALQNGDARAYNVIFKQYWKTLYHQAYTKLQSHEIAEEIVQDLFLTLWEKRSTLLISNLQHYLKASLRNKCIDHIRARMVKDKYWTYYKTFIPRQTNNTQEMVTYNNLVEALESGMARLPEKTKAIFSLSRFEGRSVADVAKDLQLSEKAVEYHLTKSLKVLKVYLKDFVFLLLLFLI